MDGNITIHYTVYCTLYRNITIYTILPKVCMDWPRAVVRGSAGLATVPGTG